MSIRLNHTIVAARDKRASANFHAQGEIESQHYAFLVGEGEFDAILGRIRRRDVPYWADPFRKKASEVRHRDGARAVYFDDPSGHLLEVLTPPSAGAQAS